MTEQAGAPRYPRPRRQATALEAKALAHPLRARILRLCLQHELTNKQLADRLGVQPGTVFYHVRLLLDAGLLQPAEVRTGASGALEKPYRSTGTSWWLDNPLGSATPEVQLSPVVAFEDELREAGPDGVGAEHDPAAVEPVGECPGWQREEQPRQREDEGQPGDQRR